MRQSRDDVSQTVGDQDRLRWRQSTFLEVLGQPVQIEPGKDDTGNLTLFVAESVSKMDHFHLADRIDEVIADR